MAHEIVTLNGARVLKTSVAQDGTSFTNEVNAQIAELRAELREKGMLASPPTLSGLEPYIGHEVVMERLTAHPSRRFVDDPSTANFNDDADLFRGVLFGEILIATLVADGMVLGGGESSRQGVNLTAQPDAAAFYAKRIITDYYRKRQAIKYIADVFGLEPQEVENSTLMTPLVLRYKRETLGDKVSYVKSVTLDGISDYVLPADIYDCTPPPRTSQSTPECLEQIRQVTGFDFNVGIQASS